jgi:hypothetical protein
MNQQQTNTRQDQFATGTQGKYPMNDQNQYDGGAPNRVYNLVSVLYHALEGGATYGKYIQDAQQEGDQELAQFFQQTQQEEKQRAQRAQSLLAQRLSG